MMDRALRTTLRHSAASILLSALVCGAAFAQRPVLTALYNAPGSPGAAGSVPATPFSTTTSTRRPIERHKFWDTENTILFSANAAFATADFFVTRANLQNGGRELNPLVRPLAGSTAGLAVNFAGETAGVIGLSYFFHQTGHHKLERLTSMVNLSSSGFAVTYGLTHR